MQKYKSNLQDATGRALTNAQVTVLNLDNSLATLYRDNVGTPLDNPLVTNRQGEFEFYVANGRYSLRIQAPGYTSETDQDVILALDPDSFMTDEVQPYADQAAEGASNALRQQLAEPGGGEMVAFQQAGTGAVTRTTQDKMRDFVDVLDYGADPTATVDSTDAFLKARDTGKIVRFRGRFLVTHIPMIPGFTLLGASKATSRLYLKDGANKTVLAGIDVSDVILRDFYIYGNKAAQSIGAGSPWRGIYGTGEFDNWLLENVHVDDATDHGIMVNGTSTSGPTASKGIISIGCAASNCGSPEHAAAGGPGGTGLLIGGEKTLVIGYNGWGNQLNGLKNASGTHINCVCTDNIGGGFETGFDTPASVGAAFIGCKSMRNGGGGFRHQGQGDQLMMLACRASENGSSGVNILGALDKLTISGGYYANNGQGGNRVAGSGGLDGITILGESGVNPTDISICGGAQIFDDQATKTQEYGVYITGQSDRVVIDDSVIMGQHKIGCHYIAAAALSRDIRIGRYIGNPMSFVQKGSVPSTGSGTTVLSTMTIPGNAVPTGTSLRIRASGRVAGTAGTKTIRLLVGSATHVITTQAAGDQNAWAVEAVVDLGGSTVRNLRVLYPTSAQTTFGQSATAPLTIAVNATPAGGDVVTLDSFSVQPE